MKDTVAGEGPLERQVSTALGEIAWSNDTTWQSEAARAALKEKP